jgi:hypothetical protein
MTCEALCRITVEENLQIGVKIWFVQVLRNLHGCPANNSGLRVFSLPSDLEIVSKLLTTENDNHE